MKYCIRLFLISILLHNFLFSYPNDGAGWLITKRDSPLPVFGPKGAKEMTDYLQKAYAFDIKMRIEDDKSPIAGSKLLTADIEEGIVYEKNGVKVIAFLVDHRPLFPHL